jgi:hypothetical protein
VERGWRACEGGEKDIYRELGAGNRRGKVQSQAKGREV